MKNSQTSSPILAIFKARSLFVFLIVANNFRPAASLAQSNVEADPTYYKFFPGSILHVGNGLDLDDVSKPKAGCIIFKPDTLEHGGSGSFTSYLVTDSREINTLINIDSKADASFSTFSAGGSFDLNSSYVQRSHDMSIVITDFTSYGRIAVPATYSYNKSTMAVLSNNRAFQRLCGDRVVLVEDRGASVSAIITLNNLSDEEIADIKTGGSFSGGVSKITASISLNVEAYMRRTANRGSLSVQTFFSGIAGLAQTEGLIRGMSTEVDAISKIQAELANMVKTMGPRFGVPVGFHVGDFPQTDTYAHWLTADERAKKKLVAAYKKNSYYMDELDGILKKQSALSFGFEESEVKHLSKLYDELASVNDKISTQHKRLSNRKINSAKIDFTNLEISDEALDKIDSFSNPPKFYRRVYVDGRPTTYLQTKTILNGDNQPADLLQRTQQFYPSATRAETMLIIKGYSLQSYQLKWKGSDNKFKNVALKVIDSNRAIISKLALYKDLPYRPIS